VRRDSNLHLTLSRGSRATAKLRKAVETFSRHHGLSSEDCFDLKLAATEALTNALKRTPEPHTVEVKLTGHAATVEVEILDRGVFSPVRASLSHAAEAESGRGVALMLALADSVSFERTSTGTRVRLRKCGGSPPTLRLAG
jgi:anti-sigma regulatory factor (Ser/Thr protein kinase)